MLGRAAACFSANAGEIPANDRTGTSGCLREMCSSSAGAFRLAKATADRRSATRGGWSDPPDVRGACYHPAGLAARAPLHAACRDDRFGIVREGVSMRRRFALSAILVVGTATMAWGEAQQRPAHPPPQIRRTSQARSRPTRPRIFGLLRYCFEPGARTNWHSHEGGQVIVVEQGRMRSAGAREGRQGVPSS